VFDVHPPHGAIRGLRDFSIQLITITVGLLIALSLEGTVEWIHHRHLMHEAQASLLKEIKANAAAVPERLKVLQEQQAALKAAISALTKIIAHPDSTAHDSMSIGFSITGFESVSWTTAQTTGAITYMPYELAEQYSDIYSEQALIELQVQQAIRDMTVSVGPFVGSTEGASPPNAEDAKVIKRNVETLQGQLYLIGELNKTMAELYKQFLDAHPN
jgi:hypothetical protein